MKTDPQRPKSLPIPVRLDGFLLGRLEKAARRLGSNKSSVSRLSVLAVLPQIESGRLIIPELPTATKEAA